MGFEPRGLGLKGQLPSRIYYKIEHEECEAELRLLIKKQYRPVMIQILETKLALGFEPRT
jgi:hypothetical protein